MNYSTIKKAVVLSLVFVLGIAAVSEAQDTTKTAMSSTAKIFGGRGQYRTWSVGVNAGVLAPAVFIGGSNDFTNWDVNLGYGATIRKQLAHSFGIELGGFRGKLSGNNSEAPGGVANDRRSFKTDFGWAGTIMGVINVGTVDFLRRENNVNFLVKAGYGVAAYAPTYVTGNGTSVSWKGHAGGDSKKYVHEQFIPVGAGIKFKISDRVNFDLGYTMHFLDGDNLDGTEVLPLHKDKFSYGYGGLEFSLGSSSKPNLDWSNPIALMYDELKDEALRREVEALKGRVSSIESTVKDLSTDSDGDGVSDKFDKCPNTPAGTVVDGSGCPIVFPKPEAETVNPYSNVQFDFNSSVLKTSSYEALDVLSAELRGNTSQTVVLNGYASIEGTEEYNLQLSKDRANSVKTYLVNSGVDSKQITTKGWGVKNPVASNATEEGRMMNRRVEIAKKY
ncbi:MAG TPA: OmpA family protein [Daejeonella sp.]|nr:OmpA family protein [Daejeonella sp.]